MKDTKVITIILFIVIALEIVRFGLSVDFNNKYQENQKSLNKEIASLQDTYVKQSEAIEDLKVEIDYLKKRADSLSERVSLAEKSIKTQQSINNANSTANKETKEATEETQEVSEPIEAEQTEEVQPDPVEEPQPIEAVDYEEPQPEPTEEPYVEEPVYEEEEYYEEPASDNGMTYYGAVNCTAYTHTGENTASGVYPTAGVTVASNDLPFGTVIYIEGYGERVVQDTGYMPWASLDLFFDSEEECVQFGEKVLDVYIVN